MKGLNIRKHIIVQNSVFYVLGIIFAVGLKYYYSHAGSEDLNWILGPTAGLVEHISGIEFDRELHTGFVSRARQIIIAPSCAGVNFFIIAFCMTLFSCIQRFRHFTQKCLWFVSSVMGAYLLTIMVNPLRIIFSIYLYDLHLHGEWLTPERIHRMEGILFYFLFLCLFYMVIDKISFIYSWDPAKGSIDPPVKPFKYPRLWDPAYMGLIPLFWYMIITVMVPLINNAYRGKGLIFTEHSLTVMIICLVVFLFFLFLQMLFRSFNRTIMKTGWKRIQ